MIHLLQSLKNKALNIYDKYFIKIYLKLVLLNKKSFILSFLLLKNIQINLYDTKQNKN